MCGICCALSINGVPNIAEVPKDFLQRRGPDSCRERTVSLRNASKQNVTIHFLSTVLSLRGQDVVAQPLVDEQTGTIFCWNGEAWSIDGKAISGNDSLAVFQLLLSVSKETKSLEASQTKASLIRALSLIRGPYAFVFYDACSSLLFYGRDCLGRRSLVQSHDSTGNLIFSSVSSWSTASSHAWTEVGADGIYVIDLSGSADQNGSDTLVPFGTNYPRERIPYTHPETETAFGQLILTYPFPALNKTLVDESVATFDNIAKAADTLELVLHRSLDVRVTDIRRHSQKVPSTVIHGSSPSEVAILFSGGLDCTVLARMVHDILPHSLAIDLLNVAFQNPRIHKSNGASGDTTKSAYDECPDRITARKSYLELQNTCPSRQWNLVQINVPYDETLAHRSIVKTLIYPHNTEMDFSIAIALYFASRGVGVIQNGPEQLPYTSTARVLLSGLGADELFGGYQRHATAFARLGFEGLVDELELDFNRLGKRNLGRDDRVMAHWGKEVRFPYLDEDLLAWALAAPVWQKCGFGTELSDSEDGDRPPLEPGKLVLRLLAWKLGMREVAREKKRAIQFGARTAKMEGGKVKGTQLLS